MKKVRVGINGFGRIGRIFFRYAHEDLDIVGINNIGSLEQSAHLLKYDSTHRIFPKEVHVEGQSLWVDGKEIPFSNTREPENIPWEKWGVDVVVECTGAFKQREDLLRHKKSGAKKILVSAPAPGADLTVVYGVNHKSYNPDQHDIVSNASCTTNCLAPLAQVIHQNFGIVQGFMTTIHSYTNDQKVLDAAHKDLRRARAAALSMIPTSTGAAKAVGKVLPELQGKIDGVAIRVPTPDVSLVDLVARVEKAVTKEAVNEALLQAAEGDLKGILRCEGAPLVSSDFIGDTYSSIVDLPSTMVMDSHFLKVFSWYDNEVGFSCRMKDMVLHMMNP